jgi:hypothetical protein
VFGIGNGGLSGCSKSKKRSTRAPSKRVKTRHPAATAAATLPAAVGKVTFITSFQMTAGGSTAVSSVTCTVSPVAVSGATLSYTFFHFGDPSIRRQTRRSSFQSAIASECSQSSIVASCPALGAGSAQRDETTIALTAVPSSPSLGSDGDPEPVRGPR